MKSCSMLLAVALTLLVGACSKSGDPVSPGSTAVNTVKYSFNRGADESTAYRWAEGAYSTDSSMTILGFSVTASRPNDEDEADGMVFTFPGNATGTFTVGMTASSFLFRDSTMYIGISGAISVTKYGAVGQTIEGTYTGRMVSFNVFGGSSDTIDVKEFRFSAKRLADDTFVVDDEDGEGDGDGDDDTGDGMASFSISGPFPVTGNFVLRDALGVGVETQDDGVNIRYGSVLGILTHGGVDYQVNMMIPLGSGTWRTGAFPWVNPNIAMFGSFWMNLANLSDLTKVYQLTALTGETVVTSVSGGVLKGTASGTCTTMVNGEEVTVTISNVTFELLIFS